MSRAPIDTSGGRPTSKAELNVARQLVRKSGVVNVLSPFLEAGVGRPRQLSLEALMVALQLNALHRHHQAHLVEAARVLNALTDGQRTSLGLSSWDEAEAYPRVDRLFVTLCQILESGDAGVDATWFANQLARAAIPRGMLTSRSVAVDGTDVETWGALQGASCTVEVDGEAAETQLIDEAGSAQTKTKVKTAKVLGTGPDGRKRYTADPDARAGHRSSAGNRKAGPYVGYELHLAVQTRDVRWTNHTDRTTLGPEVPGVITTCNLVSAGSHRGDAIVEALVASKTGRPCHRQCRVGPGILALPARNDDLPARPGRDRADVGVGHPSAWHPPLRRGCAAARRATLFPPHAEGAAGLGRSTSVRHWRVSTSL